MNQSQLTTIRNTLTTRVEVLAASRYPSPTKEIDGSNEITKSLVHGKKVALRPFAEIKRRALDRIAAGGYSEKRSLNFDDVFETSSEIEAARRERAATDIARDKFKLKLDGIKARVMADCKLGTYDTEQGAAVDAFEAAVEQINR